MIKNILKKAIFIFVMFLCNKTVSALSYEGCDYQTIANLKNVINNINISYDYHEEDNQVYFDVTINNIIPQIYFVDSNDGKTYYYSDTNSGEITIKNYTYASNYKFYSNIDECKGLSIGTKYYTFPTYNRYYNDPLCEGINDFEMCKKWVKSNVSYDTFVSSVVKYKNSFNNQAVIDEPFEYEESFSDYLAELYVNYYYYFFIGIIVICVTIILISRRKNRFKL